jgi:hypothetical protein
VSVSVLTSKQHRLASAKLALLRRSEFRPFLASAETLRSLEDGLAYVRERSTLSDYPFLERHHYLIQVVHDTDTLPETGRSEYDPTALPALYDRLAAQRSEPKWSIRYPDGSLVNKLLRHGSGVGFSAWKALQDCSHIKLVYYDSTYHVLQKLTECCDYKEWSDRPQREEIFSSVSSEAPELVEVQPLFNNSRILSAVSPSGY